MQEIREVLDAEGITGADVEGKVQIFNPETGKVAPADSKLNIGSLSSIAKSRYYAEHSNYQAT